MNRTSIQWTDRSANPIRARNRITGKVGWHCVMISPGCAHCYAGAMNRWRGTGLPFTQLSANEIELFLDMRVLEAIIKLKKPQRFFVCDMTDAFLDIVSDNMLDHLFATAMIAQQHTFQILTKRPERMLEYFMTGAPSVHGQHDNSDRYRAVRRAASAMWRRMGKNPELLPGAFWPLPNVWLGVSTEDQKRADERIPHLLKTPAAVRFLSVEPLLEQIDLNLWRVAIPKHREHWPAERVRNFWVIVGGESGPGARECFFGWIEKIVEQCRDAGVPCFVKQAGSHPMDAWQHRPGDIERRRVKLQDRKGGNPEEWPEVIRIRQFPEPNR